MTEQRTSLDLLRLANFDWTQNLQSVWVNDPFNLPSLHASAQKEFTYKIQELIATPPAAPSLLGWPMVGSGGVGKTHLLGNFRSIAADSNCAFIMIDMTDVRDFWETVLAGFTTSLEQVYVKNEPQRYFVIKGLVNYFSFNKTLQKKLKESLNANHKANRSNAKGILNDVLSMLHKEFRSETNVYQDIIRAVIIADCDDYELASIGQNWLQGLAIDEEDQRAVGFVKNQQKTSDIVAALSWLISLGSPAVIAFDQFDPIIRQLEYRTAQSDKDLYSTQDLQADQIISSIADGFSAMYDLTRRSLCILSCLESSYTSMRERVLSTSFDRYESPSILKPIETSELGLSLIANRVNFAAQKLGITEPYAGWPIAESDLTKLANLTPREILKRLGAHRKQCLITNVFKPLYFTTETQPSKPLPPIDADHLHQLYERYQQEANIDVLLDETVEDDSFAQGIKSVCRALIRELQFPSSVSPIVDTLFTGGSKTKPLHARIRLVFTEEEEREEHYSIRVIQRQNARAFQNRLKLAITQAGIDRSLGFRHLAIVRTNDIPSGRVTGEICQHFQHAGGLFVDAPEAELRAIDALRRLMEGEDPNLDSWLIENQPASKLSICQQAFGTLIDLCGLQSQDTTPPPLQRTTSETPNAGGQSFARPPQNQQPEDILQSQYESAEQSPKLLPEQFPLGRDSAGKDVLIPMNALAKHTVVLAGAGSGKTVLLKRTIESAALRGIPSIVIDGANDLAALAEAWPEPPAGWLPGDAELAASFHKEVQTLVWTPGRQSGNPIGLDLAPDLSHTLNDEDEFEAGVAMIAGSLAELLNLGSGKIDNNKRGILTKTVRFYAQNAGVGLQGLITILADLPAGARIGIDKESKLAGELADGLRVLEETDPLICDSTEVLDPAVLFGDDKARPETRVSVVNLDSLGRLDRQQQFINQLSTTLFSWIKQNPIPPNGRVLRGLLILDEAKDFIPSRKSTACKDNVIRLAAQARKYGLGLVFATQNPREIDNTVIGNCSTHFYGKANSPAAIETIQSLVRERGGTVSDIARLAKGEFYTFNADTEMMAPQKIKSPLCLSNHRTMEPSEVLELARSSRETVTGGIRS